MEDNVAKLVTQHKVMEIQQYGNDSLKLKARDLAKHPNLSGCLSKLVFFCISLITNLEATWHSKICASHTTGAFMQYWTFKIFFFLFNSRESNVTQHSKEKGILVYILIRNIKQRDCFQVSIYLPRFLTSHTKWDQ